MYPHGGDGVAVIPPGSFRAEGVVAEVDYGHIRQSSAAPYVQHAVAVEIPRKTAFYRPFGDALRRAADAHSVMQDVVAVAVRKMVPPRGGDGLGVAVTLGALLTYRAGPGPYPVLGAVRRQSYGAAVVVTRRVCDIV